MIKVTYKALNCGEKGWSIVTYVSKQYSHTLPAVESEAKAGSPR